MPLFAVERDLSQVPPEYFRANLPGLVAACARLQSLGRKVRYISTAVFPAEARGFCLFGAEEPRWIHEVNEAARIPYSRIYPMLDLTPTGVRRDLSRGRWPVRVESAPAPAPGAPNGGPPYRPTARVAEDLARWSDEARRLVQVMGALLEEVGHRQVEVEALERERASLADDVKRLGLENEVLHLEREDLSRALQAIAGQTARAMDEILSRISGPRRAPGDLAER
jgi:hypothetical protein